MLPHQVLQASLVSTAGPTPHGLPDRSLKGQCRQGLGTGVVTAPTLLCASSPGARRGKARGTGQARCISPQNPQALPSSGRPTTAPAGARVPKMRVPGVDVHVHRLPRVPFHPCFSLMTAWTALVLVCPVCLLGARHRTQRGAGPGVG